MHFRLRALGLVGFVLLFLSTPIGAASGGDVASLDTSRASAAGDQTAGDQPADSEEGYSAQNAATGGAPWRQIDLHRLFGTYAADRQPHVVVSSTPELPLLHSWFDGAEGRQGVLAPPRVPRLYVTPTTSDPPAPPSPESPHEWTWLELGVLWAWILGGVCLTLLFYRLLRRMAAARRAPRIFSGTIRTIDAVFSWCEFQVRDVVYGFYVVAQLFAGTAARGAFAAWRFATGRFISLRSCFTRARLQAAGLRLRAAWFASRNACGLWWSGSWSWRLRVLRKAARSGGSAVGRLTAAWCAPVRAFCTASSVRQRRRLAGAVRLACTFAAIGVVALPMTPIQALAATVYWDSDANAGNNNVNDGSGLGGTGFWNLSNVNWWNGAAVTDQLWNNGNLDTAVFWGSAGTVTLGDNITAGGLTFNTGGYTIAGGGNTLTLGGAAPAITLNSGASASILADLDGITGLTANLGTGTLTLGGTNVYSGGTVVNGSLGGTLRLASTSALGVTSSNVTLNGGTLSLGTDTSVNAYNVTVARTSTIVADRATAGVGITHTLGTLNIGGQQLNIAGGSNVTSGTAGVQFGATTLTAHGTTFNVGANSNLTLGAVAGAFNYWKTGAGTLTLNTNAGVRATGATYLLGGTLSLGGAGTGTVDPLGSAAAVTLVVGGGSTLDLAIGTSTATGVSAHPTTIIGNATFLSGANTPGTPGFQQLLGALTVLDSQTITIGPGSNIIGTGTIGFGAATTNAPTTFMVNAGAALNLASTLNNGGSTTTFNGAGNVTLTGIVSGGGGLTFNNTGTTTITAANTFGGNTTISGGTVTVGNAAALGAVATSNIVMTGGTLNLNALVVSAMNITGSSGAILQNNAAGNQTFAITPGANNTASFAGTIQNGGTGTLGITVNGAGALTLSGDNTYSGITTLTAGQLNVNSATALGTNVTPTGLTVAGGILDNTSGGAIALSNNTSVTMSGNFTFGGSNSLSFGTGTATTAGARVLTLMGTNNATLSFGTWNNNYATSTTTVNALPGSNSTVTIGRFTSTSTGTVATILGNGNINVTGGIQPGVAAAASIVYSNAGTMTVSGASSYTGATTVNSGTFILDNSGDGTTFAGSGLNLGGGTFVYKGGAGGSTQSIGNLVGTAGTAVIAVGSSRIQVVGGASGSTTLALGTVTLNNNSLLNIVLSGTNPAVTTTTLDTNGILGARGAVTVTTGGTTEFGHTGAAGTNPIVQYTGQDAWIDTPTTATTNYSIVDSPTQLQQTESINSLKISDTAAGHSLDLNGKILTVTSGGILYVGSNGYTIQDVAGGGSLKSNTATASDLIFHNYGGGALNVSAVIANGIGTSVVSVGGPGTTILSGINTYTGITSAGGGAVLSIGANSGLGLFTTGAALTLNNATLQATNSFALDNGGANIRAIAMGPGGGTFDVTGANTLTVRGVVSGTGSLTKVGTGTLLLTTGVNTYTGGFTNIREGSLQLGGTTGSITAGNIVVLGNGTTSGKLVLGEASSIKAQTIAGLMTLGSGTDNAVVAGGAATNSTLNFTGNLAVPSIFAGTIGGAGTNQNNLVVNVTAGALTLSGNNTFTGGMTLSGTGVLNLNSSGTGATNSAIGTGTFNITGGSLDNTSGVAVTLATNNLVTLGGNLTFGGGNSLSFGSNSTVTMAASRAVTLLGGTTSTSRLAFGNWNVTAPALTLTVSAQQGSGTALEIGTLDLNTGANGTATIITGNGSVNVTNLIKSTNAAQAFTYSGTGTLTIGGSTATYGGLTSITGAGTVRLDAGGALPTNALTITNGVFDLNGNNQTVGRLTLTAPGLITNSSTTAATFTANDVATSTGNISGKLTANIALTTATAAVLSGNFTNTGNLNFSNSTTAAFTLSSPNVLNIGNITLAANNTGAFAVSAPNLNNTGTITNSGSGTNTTVISGVVGANVTGIIQNSATSQLTLSGANTNFSGTVDLLQGRLNLGAAGALGGNGSTTGGTFTIGGGTTLDSTVANLVLSTVNAQVWNGSGFTFLGTQSLTMGSGGITFGSPATNYLITVSANTLTQPGLIADNGGSSLTKLGAGTLALTNTANSYTGSITINAGGLSLASLGDSGVGSNGTGNIVINNGSVAAQLTYTGSGATLNTRDLILSGNTGGVTLDSSGSGALVINSAITNNTTGATTLTLQGSNTGANTISSVLANSGANVLTVTKAGTGTWVLGNANTFTGNATLTAGSLRLTNVDAVQDAPLRLNGGILQLRSDSAVTFNSASTTVGGNTTIDVDQLTTGQTNNPLSLGPVSIGAFTLGVTGNTSATGYSLELGALTLTGAAVLNPTSANVSVASATAATNQNLTLGGTSLGNTIGAIATLAGTLTKSGTSTWTLNATNTFSGGTTISGGILNAAAINALGAASSTVTITAGTLNANVSQSINSISVGRSPAGGTLNVTAGTFNIIGGGSGGLFIGDTAVGATGVVNLSGGAITVGGASGVVLARGASSTNTGESGTLNLLGGILTAPKISMINAGGSIGVVNFDGGTLRASAASGSFMSGLTAANILSGGATFDSNNFAVTIGQALSGSGGVTIIDSSVGGGGVVTLSGANTYTGATAVTSGGLTLGGGGSMAGTAISVTSAAPLTIQGNYTIGTSGSGSLSIASGGTLSLVDSALRTLTINNTTVGATVLTLGGASFFNFDVGNGVDQILLGSGLKAIINAGVVTLNPSLAGALTNGTYTLINASGGGLLNTNGTLGTFALSNTTIGGATLSLNVTDTLLQLIIANSPPAPTGNVYFRGVTNTWNSFAGGELNWSTDTAGTLATQALPGTATDVHFYATSATAGNLDTVLGQDFSIQTLSYDLGTNAVSIDGTNNGGGGFNTLTITPIDPTTGITIAAGVGSLTISAPIILGADQTWTNGSSSTLTISGGMTGDGNLTIKANTTAAINIIGAPLNNIGTIINSGSSTGTTTISGGIGSNVRSITQSGGTLTINSTPINVNVNGTSLINNGTTTFTASGGILGTGNLLVRANSSGAFAIGSVNNAGTVTNSGSGTATTTISGAIGLNVTGVIQNSATSNMSLTTANTFNTLNGNQGLVVKAGTVFTSAATSMGAGTVTLGNTTGNVAATITSNQTTTAANYANPIVLATGTTGLLSLVNNTAVASATTYSGGITGVNDFRILNNASSTAGTMTFATGSINNAGTLTNAGTGPVAATINSVIGPNVTGVIQNSATSVLSLAAANTYSGATSVNAGTLRVTAGSMAGTAVNVAANATLLTTAATYTIGNTGNGSLTVAGGGILSLLNSAANTLNINNTISGATALTMGGTTVGSAGILNLDLMSATSVDTITLGAGLKAFIDAGGVILNPSIFGSLAVTASPLTLISASGGGLLNTNGSIGTFNFSNGMQSIVIAGNTLTLSVTDTLLQLNVTNVVAAQSDLYWKGGVGNLWSGFDGGGNSNWTTDLGGTTNAQTVPGAATNVHFSANSPANLTTTLGQNFSINTLSMENNTGAVVINGSQAGSTLTITPTVAGTGISSAAGSGALTINANVVVGAPLTWRNDSSNAMTITGVVSGSGGITVDSAGTGSVAFSTSVNTFTGGLVIKSGTVTGTIANSFGGSTNTLTLGDTSGSANATLSTSGAIVNTFGSILVREGSTGTLTIRSTATSTTADSTFAGAIALNNNLTVDKATSRSLIFNGALNATGTVNPLTITKLGGVGSVTFSGATTIGSGGLTLSSTLATAATSLFNLSGTVAGAGNLTLSNATNINGGIVLSNASINNTGTITNSGPGFGSTRITGTVGANVTALNQNSATSTLTLSTGGIVGTTVNVQQGTLNVQGNYTIGTTGNPTVNVSNGAILSLLDGIVGTLTINSTTVGATVLNLADNSRLNFDIGINGLGSPATDSIQLGPTGDVTLLLKAAIAGGGVVIVNPNLVSPLSDGTYTLISAPGGGLISGGANDFALSTTSLGGATLSLSITDTLLSLIVSGLTVPTTAYFGGNVNAQWNGFSGNTLNWFGDAAGTSPLTSLPGATTDVHFYTTNATTANLATTLGQNFTIKTLTMDGGALTQAVSISGVIPNSANLNSLTITPADPATGILMNLGAGALTISAPVVLGAAQTWTNNSAALLTVSGALSMGGNNLTINTNAAGGVTVSGALSLGATGADLTINGNGAGVTTLSGGVTGTGNLFLKANSTGGVTMSGGANNIGTITNSGTGTATTTFSGLVNTNVTGVTQASNTSPLTLSTTTTTLTVNAAGTTLTSSGSALFSVTTGINGTGNLNLVNNAGGNIVISGAPTNAGSLFLNANSTGQISVSSFAPGAVGTPTVINQGSGTGGVLIVGAIGANVTGGVIQNSATSTLTLTGASTYTSGTVVSAGTLALNGASLGGTGVSVAPGAQLAIQSNVTLGSTLSSSLTVSGGGILSLLDGAPNTLTINSATAGATVLTLGGASGSPSILNMEIGSSADAIVLGGLLKALVNPGGVTLNISAFGALAANSYTLISAAGGGLLNTNGTVGGLSLYNLVSNVGASLSLSSSTDTALILTVTPFLTPNTAYFLGGVSGDWTAFSGNTSNWTTDAAGTTNTNALPGSTTDVHFYATGATNLNTTLGQNFAIASLTMDAAATSNVSIGSGGGILTINPTNSTSGDTITGIKLNPGAGSLSISAPLVLGASQTWANNSGNTLTVSGGIGGQGVMTNAGTGTGGVVISSAIDTDVSGVIQNSATSQLTLSGINAFTSGLTIKSGTVLGLVNAAAFGPAANVVTLGDSAGGSAAATLLVGTTGLIIPTQIVLASTTTGTLTIGNTGTAVSTTFSGGVTGANNLTINNNATTGTITLATGAVNNAGTVTNTGLGTGTTTISAPVGTNVTGLRQASDTSAFTVSGALTVNSAGTTISSAGAALFTVSSAVSGTGNLIADADGSGNITFQTGAMNPIGSITNSGSGTGVVTFSNVIGTNVTGVFQNSATSQLTLTAANTFTSGVTINAGTLAASGSANVLGTGASTLTLAGGTLDLRHSALLAFNRATTVTGDATIISEKSVAGVGVNYTFGALSIGGNTLSVNGGNVTSGTAGLIFGATTFSGDATFNIANPVGGGATLLTLGALNDGGAARTITKSGLATMTLATAATSIVDGTRFNISAGTLNSNNATALGTLATVDVADGALFNVGATQTIGALSNTTTSLNTGSVTVGSGFVLTMGSTNNLNATFSGVISGAGGIAKGGSGTQTLTGANTFAGPVTVREGVLALAGGNNRLATSGSAAYVVTLGSGTTSGKLALGGAGGPVSQTFNQTTASGILVTSGTGTANSVVGGADNGGNPAGNSVLTLNIGTGFTDTYDGLIGGPGLFENNINLVKSGGGILVLSGDLSGWTGTGSGPNDPTRPTLTITGGVLRLTSTAVLNTAVFNTGGLIDDQGFTAGANFSLITTGGLITLSSPTDDFSSVGITAASHGVVALNFNNTGVTGFNGSDMYLGAVGARRYSGTTLAAGALNTYRFGGGAPWAALGTATTGGSGGYLQIATENVVTGANNVIIGDNGSYNSGAGLFGGNSTVEFTANQNYTGTTTLAGGTLVVSDINQLGNPTTPAGSIIFDGGIFRYAGNNSDISARATIAGGAVIDTNGQSVAFAAGIGNSNTGTSGLSDGGLAKIGLGTLTLSGANTYTGTTRVSAGTLQLNGATGSLSTTSGLTFAGPGTFRFDNVGALGAISQTLGALSFAAGDGTILSQRTAAQDTTLTFDSFARTSGATGNFTVAGAGSTAALNQVKFASPPAAGQFLDAGLYFGGNNYAAYDAGGFVRAIVYGTDTNTATSAAGVTLGANTGRDINQTGIISAQTTDTINSLRIAGAFNLTIAASNTLTITSGGLLKAGGNAASILTGTLRAGPTGTGELVVRTDLATDLLTFSSTIVAGSITKSGAGTLTLGTATNTITGQIVINGGTLAMDAQARYGATTGFTLNGGALTWTSTAALAKTFTLGLGGGTFNITGAGNQTIGIAGDSMLFAGLGARTLTIGGVLIDRRQNLLFGIGDNGGPTSLVFTGAADTSVVQLSGNNTYTGTTTINRGILQLNSALALPGGLGGTTLTTTNTGGGNLVFAATGVTRAVLELTAASGDFYRSLGTGFDQVQFTGNGGFSNGGTGTRIVNLGGSGAQVTWGSGGFVPTGNILDLAQSAGNSLGSTGIIDFQNDIQLGAAARTVDVSDGFSAAGTGGVDAILSGDLSTTAATGGLTKTGAGVLMLTGDNATGALAGSPIVVSGGYLLFDGVSSILGAAGSRNVLLAATTGVALVGATDIQPLLDRINGASAGGSVMLDTSNTSASAVIDMSNAALANITLGAYSNVGGTPIYYGGSIIANGTTYKFGSPTEASKGGLGAAASAVQRNTNLLVLTKQNVLTGANSASFNIGTFYFTNSNDFTGGISPFTGSQTNIGIGNDAALGTGLIRVTSTTDFIGSLNGDHTLSNNIQTTVTGNFVVTGNTTNDGIANPGAFTFLGTLNVVTSPSLFARAGNNATFLGDIKAVSGTPTVTFNTGIFNLLTTPAGAVNKSMAATSVAALTTLVIDSDRSLGAVPVAPATNLTLATTSTLQVQPGANSTIILSNNRNIAVAANAAWAINVAGGPVVGNSTLEIPGIISGGGTGVFSKLGLGTLTLRGQNTVAATTGTGVQIFGGTLMLDYANSGVATNMLLPTTNLTLGTGTNLAFGNGGTLSISSNNFNVAQTFAAFQFTGKDNFVVLNNISVSNSLTLNLPAAITRTGLGGTLNFQTTTAGGAITVNSTNAGTNGIVAGATWNGADLVAAGGTTLTQYTGYTALTGNTVASNTVTNVKVDNSTSGDVTLAATGTIDANTFTFFDAAARTIDVRNGTTAGTLRLGTVGTILAGSGTGPLTIGIAGTAGSLTAGGTAANAAGELIFINNSANKMTVNSAIVLNGTGVTTVVKSGTGTVALAGLNTYTGSLYLNGGILEYANGSALGQNLGSQAAAATNILMNGGTLRQTATNNLIFGLTFNTISAIDVPNTVTVTQTAQGMIGIAGVPGILQKTGLGTLTVSSTTDNLNLSVQVQAGTFNMGKASTATVHSVSGGAAAAALIIEDLATAAITGTGGDQILDTSSVVVRSGGTFNLGTQSEAIDGLAGGGSVIGTGGTLTLGGTAALTNNQANISAYTLAAAGALVTNTGLNNFSGVISGSLAVNKFGAGTQIFGGENTYSGGTTITAGTLKLATTNALPGGAGKGDVTIVGNTVIGGLNVPGTLDLGGFNQAINGLNSTTGGIIVNTIPLFFTSGAWTATAGTNTLTIGNDDANGAFNGTLQDGLTIVPVPGTGAGTSVVGVLALTKTGTGTQTLSGVNTYTGATTINGGTLIFGSTVANGAIRGDGIASKTVADVIVNSGGTLNWMDGDQIADDVTIQINAGGTLAFDGPNFTGSNRHEKFFNLINDGGTYSSGRGFTVEIVDPTWSGAADNTIAGTDIYGELIVRNTGINRVLGDATTGLPGSITINAPGTDGLLFDGAALATTLRLSSDAVTGGRLNLNTNFAYSGTGPSASGIVNSVTTTAAGVDNAGLFGAQAGFVDLGNAVRTFNVADGVGTTTSTGLRGADFVVTARVTNGGIVKQGAGELVVVNTANNNTISGGITAAGGLLTMGGNIGATGGTFALSSGGGFSAGATVVTSGNIQTAIGSIGTADFLNTGAGTSTWAGGSTLVFQFKNVAADGVTGAGTEWDLINNNVGALLINADSSNKITLLIESLSDSITIGQAANFDPTTSTDYLWKFATNVADPAAASKFQFDERGVWSSGTFTNGYGSFSHAGAGSFYVTTIANDLYVGYTAVPEPGSLFLAGLAVAGLGYRRFKRRKQASTTEGEAETQDTKVAGDA